MGEQLEESLQKSLFVLQKHVFQMIITLPQKKKKKKDRKKQWKKYGRGYNSMISKKLAEKSLIYY